MLFPKGRSLNAERSERSASEVQASPPRNASGGELPQTDTAATLQMILGLLALAAAGAVTLVSRFVPPSVPAVERIQP